METNQKEKVKLDQVLKFLFSTSDKVLVNLLNGVFDANEAKELFDEDEILGEDFHKILLGIQNLIEYLNRNYFRDDKIEEEMIDMTTTLYNPEVEKRGIEKGKKEEKLQIAINLLDVLPDEIISNKTGLSLEEVKKLRSENSI